MSNKLLILIIVVLVLGGIYLYSRSDSGVPIVQNSNEEDLVAGCYVSTLGQDVYTLKIEIEENGNFVGELSFKNFEKDSSSGTYIGTYKDGILLGDYSFNSEGMDSVMQVIFKKSGDTFIRGFGELDSTGTRFSNLNSISFDPKQTFLLTANCPI